MDIIILPAQKSLSLFMRWHKWGLVLLAAALAIIWFFAFGFHGFCDTDQGFIAGYVWRMAQGEVPYSDFVYVRPPLTLYWHLFWQQLLPINSWLLGERLLFYVTMAASSLLGLLAWERATRRPYLPAQRYVLLALGFMIATHNFAPMAWHTTDGLLFGSAGLFLLLDEGKNPAKMALGLLLLFAAAACKQAFYPMPLAGLVYIIINTNYKNLFIILSINLLFLFIIYQILPFPFSAFIRATTAAATLSDAIQVGVIQYIKPLIIIALPLIGGHFISRWLTKTTGRNWYRLYQWGGLAAFGLLLLWQPYQSWKTGEFSVPFYAAGQSALLLALAVSIVTYLSTKKIAPFLLLALAWCSGISWGFHTPVLFAAPLVAGAWEWLERPLAGKRMAGWLLVPAVAAIYGYCYQFPYRDAPRKEMIYDLGEIFPPASGLRTGASNYSKSLELQQFVQAHPQQSFTVFPAWPAAHFLTNSRNPFPAEWEHNAEINFARDSAELVAVLHNRTQWVLIERSKLEELPRRDRYGCLIGHYVRQHWPLVKQTTHWEIYQQPQ